MLTHGTTKENCRLVSRDALSSWRYQSTVFFCSSACVHLLYIHFYWKGICTTVHDVCKKFPTYQRAKTTNHKYGKLPPRQAETNPWDTLCVDLIDPYTIPQK